MSSRAQRSSQSVVIPCHKDEDGYFVPAKSSCCSARLLYYSEEAKRYEIWEGLDPDHPQLRCKRCDSMVIDSDA